MVEADRCQEILGLLDEIMDEVSEHTFPCTVGVEGQDVVEEVLELGKEFQDALLDFRWMLEED